MAFDGIFLSSVCLELNSSLDGAKVERITQPERDELIFNLYAPNRDGEKRVKLFICVNPSRPMVCLSQKNRENPLVAPNFCMLLRKHLSSSRILSVSQIGLDRILVIDFESKTEMYESVRRKLIVELMGRASNIIFTDGDFVIYDAVKQVDFSVSSKRQILPQLRYEFPSSQNRADIRFSPEFIYDFSSDERADKVLNLYFTGFSPLISREIVFRSTGSVDKKLSDFSHDDKERLEAKLKKLSDNIKNNEFKFSILTSDKPLDFYCFPISQYGATVDKIEYKTPSETVENFFENRMKTEIIKRHSADLMKAVNTAISRVVKKIAVRETELENCKKAGNYKHYGDVLFANINFLGSKGNSFVRVKDYYSEDSSEITIPLEPSLSPVKNAQRYYKLYKKAQTAKDFLQKEIPAAREELNYLTSVKRSIEIAENFEDLREIREELIKEGYIKQTKKAANGKSHSKKIALATFITSENIPVYVGKNNTQNDWLTTKFAKKDDIWFHVKNYPGSHTILACSGKTYTDVSLKEAAVIAASFCGVLGDGKIEVDYLPVKGVKKPSGAKPGMVVYEGYKTMVVYPNKLTVEKLRLRD